MQDKLNDKPHDKFFGRRKGKTLKKASQDRFDSVLPRISITLDEHTSLDPNTLFNHDVNALWFEVGFGGGEHMAWQARNHKNISIIGCEPYINGTAKLLRDIEKIRVYPDDARPIMGLLKQQFYLF